MTHGTLEQRTDEKQGIKNSETLTTRCHYCEKELQIPKNSSLECNKQYDGFYISPEGNSYCNRYCFTMFTED